MKNLTLFLRLSRPLFLIEAALLYAMGVGIAHYLGAIIDWRAFILGQTWVSLLQISTTFLNEYHNSAADRENPDRTYRTKESNDLGDRKLSPRIALMSAMTSLAILASLTVVLISLLSPPSEIYLIMGLGFLGAFFYSSPPLRLESSGYGELVVSVLVALLVPGFAFILQVETSHRLLAMTAFPLVALHLAMLLAFEFPDYAADIKYEKRTLLVRLGWKNGMMLHNVLVLSAFLLLLLAGSFGYPGFAVVAGMLPLPIGVFQILQMRNIANGAKPNWKILITGAAALFLSSAYLLAFTFWTN